MLTTAQSPLTTEFAFADAFAMNLRFWKRRVANGDASPTPRRTGRLCQHTLLCNLGRVVDISAGGMRVLARRVPRGLIEVRLVGHPLPGPLKAVRQWSRRVGWFQHEIGLKFDGVSPDVAQKLTAIACSCRLKSHTV